MILQEFTSRSRLGRKSGAGIYDYGPTKERIHSNESVRVFAPAVNQPSFDEIEQRLFVIQTLEALHAVREGIIEDFAMADLASVLGWSYPAHRGGVMSYIDFVGRAEFERRTCRPAAKARRPVCSSWVDFQTRTLLAEDRAIRGRQCLLKTLICISEKNLAMQTLAQPVLSA